MGARGQERRCFFQLLSGTIQSPEPTGTRDKTQIQPSSSPPERFGERVGALKSHLLPCPRPHPSVPRGSPSPASHLRSKELEAEPHGRNGPRRGFEVRALERQRKGHSLRWPLGFYQGSRWPWHHPDAIQASGAAVRGRDSGFPWDARELCDRLPTQMWRALPPCQQL